MWYNFLEREWRIVCVMPVLYLVNRECFSNMTGISVLVVLTKSPCLSFRASPCCVSSSISSSAHIWWTVQTTFDSHWIKNDLLCAAVYSQHSHLPCSYYKNIVLVSIWCFCGSQELREDVITLCILSLLTNSGPHCPDFLFSDGVMFPHIHHPKVTHY